MFRLVVSAFLLVVTGLAGASEETSDHPAGTFPHAWGAWAIDGREGGEDLGSAVPIVEIPFTDSGATCDNLDDYDEVCPYTGSTSPDVVYSFVATGDDLLDIDLCGSAYDTKVYIYENLAGNLVGCNDDFYFDEVCGIYVSRIQFQEVAGGNTYYIVVDGYGGDCGEYVIDVRQNEVCDLVCPVGGVDEGEPDLEDYYIDEHNGGCSGVPPMYQVLQAIDEPDCMTLCSESGWYFSGGSFRDTDWFEVTAVSTQISIQIDAEYATNCFVLNTDCNDLQILYSLQDVGPCAPEDLVFPTVPGEVVWIWVGPSAFSGPVYEFDYLLTVCGIYGAIDSEISTWGGVKDLYR